MAGIYIHIPFCRQACHYCNFHFSTSLRYKNELVASLLKELEYNAAYLGHEKIDSIYFGGGTPSLLSDEELRLLLSTIYSFYNVCANPEITLETNPDDISDQKLNVWKVAGINRLSIGVQSFFDEDLQWMNRAHNAKQALDSLDLAKKYFDNLTVDLIYGTPYLTDEKWKQNVEKAVLLNIPHLSCYALTVEPKTPLDKMIRLHKTADVDPEKQSAQFLLLMHWLEAAGYEHYEISNFSKPGWQSRHNTAYWQGKNYLGIGPSAHSFNGTTRQWNMANNQQYIHSINNNEPSFEKEILTATQQLNEYIMVSLRTMQGINLEIIEVKFGIKENDFLKKGKKFISNGLIVHEKNSLVLTRGGKLLADGIAADLFF